MKIRNWNRFQHFKDRRPPWIKLYREILDDVEWHNLSGEAAKSLIMLWLIASESDGNLPSTKTIAFRLRSPEKSIEKLLKSLSHWLEQSDIKAISSRYHDDAPETETETETEGEGEGRAGKPAPLIPKTKHLRFVLLTDDEHAKLMERLNGHADEMIERLDGYIGQIGSKKAATKYRSHYDTILNWWRKDVADGKAFLPAEPAGDQMKKIPHDVTFNPRGEAFRNGQRCPEFD